MTSPYREPGCPTEEKDERRPRLALTATLAAFVGINAGFFAGWGLGASAAASDAPQPCILRMRADGPNKVRLIDGEGSDIASGLYPHRTFDYPDAYDVAEELGCEVRP